jgi:XTP/dITP diphosphohydrolase
LTERRLVLATRNDGKIREITGLLSGLSIEILTYEDFDVWPELEETGATFEENAIAKASALSGWSGLPALADDSGLEVDALRGRPGVRSARYAGTQGDAPANIALLLKEMKGIPVQERGARFVCVIALTGPSHPAMEVRDTCKGAISEAAQGEGGFGYDPVFVPTGEERTMAELSMQEKNAISHRGKALRRLRAMLEAGEPAWLWK